MEEWIKKSELVDLANKYVNDRLNGWHPFYKMAFMAIFTDFIKKLKTYKGEIK